MYVIGSKNMSPLGVSMENILYKEYTSEVMTCFDDIEEMFSERETEQLSPENMEAELFGEASKNDEANTSFVTALGKKVRELIQKITDMINKFMGHFRKEDEVAKRQRALVEAAVRKDPSLKNQVIELAQSGALNLQDIKTINELEAEVDNLMEEKNPKTLREKFEKLKKKWDDPQNTKTAKRIAFAAATVGLITAVVKLGPELCKASDTMREHTRKTNKELQAIHSELASRGVDTEKLGLLQEKLVVMKWKAGKQGEAMALINKDYATLNNAVAKFLKKVDNSKAAKSVHSKNVANIRENIRFDKKSAKSAKNNSRKEYVSDELFKAGVKGNINAATKSSKSGKDDSAVDRVARAVGNAVS